MGHKCYKHYIIVSETPFSNYMFPVKNKNVYYFYQHYKFHLKNLKVSSYNGSVKLEVKTGN